VQIHILEMMTHKFDKDEPHDGSFEDHELATDVVLSRVLQINNVVGFILQIYQFFSNFRHLKKCSDFNLNQVSFDLLFIFANVTLNVLILLQNNSGVNETKKWTLEHIRILSAIVMVLMLYRLTQFLNMSSEISPLID